MLHIGLFNQINPLFVNMFIILNYQSLSGLEYQIRVCGERRSNVPSPIVYLSAYSSAVECSAAFVAHRVGSGTRSCHYGACRTQTACAIWHTSGLRTHQLHESVEVSTSILQGSNSISGIPRVPAPHPCMSTKRLQAPAQTKECRLVRCAMLTNVNNGVNAGSALQDSGKPGNGHHLLVQAEPQLRRSLVQLPPNLLRD